MKQTPKKDRRGGKRPGAGRPVSTSAKRAILSVRVSDDSMQRIRDAAARQQITVQAFVNAWAESLGDRNLADRLDKLFDELQTKP